MPLGVAIAFAAVLVFNPFAKKTSAQSLSYTGFVNEVTTDKVSTATITSTGSVSGKLRSGTAYTSQIPTALNDDALSTLLVQHKVQVRGTDPGGSSALSVLLSLLPFLFILGVFIWLGRRGGKQLGGIMSIGKSKAKVYDEERPSRPLRRHRRL